LVIDPRQVEVCERYGVDPVPTPPGLKVGIAANVREGVKPINGLRHPPEGNTSGWYIWPGGEIPQHDPTFFEPVHLDHIEEWCPATRTSRCRQASAS
jgi:hypothetical protein